MAIIAYSPKNVSIATETTAVPQGLTPAAFRPVLNAYVAAVEDKVQSLTAYLEQLQTALGFGCISGGVISIGTGLSVNVSALSAFVGTVVGYDAVSVVGGLAESDVTYIWLRQDGFWSKTLSMTPPTDITTHGSYLYWGNCTTSSNAVTAVNNDRVNFYGLSGMYQIANVDSDFVADYRRIILVDATADDVDITMPDPATVNFTYTIKKTTGTNSAIILPHDAETFDGQADITLTDNYSVVELISDGTNWLILSNYNPPS